MADFQRSFLFLGGVPSHLAPPLAAALRDAGHRANIARRSNGIVERSGRDNGERWSDWVQQRLVDQDVTDLCLSSDGGQAAQEAAVVAKQLGLRIWRLGPGYFGRGWITCTAAEFPLDLVAVREAWADGPDVDPSRIGRPSPSMFDGLRAMLPKRKQTRYGPRRLSKGAPYTLIMSREGQSREGAEQLYRFAISTAARHADLSRNLVIRLWPTQPGPRAMNRHLGSLIRRAGLKGQVTFTREETLDSLVLGAESVVTSAAPVASLALARARPILPMNLPFEVAERSPPDMSVFWSISSVDDPDGSAALLRCLASMQVAGHLDARADRDALVARLTARMLEDVSDIIPTSVAGSSEEEDDLASNEGVHAEEHSRDIA